MFLREFAKDIAKIGGNGQVAVFVEFLRRKARPFAEYSAAVHVTAHRKEASRVAVIGAAVAVLPDGAAKLAHGEDHNIAHAVAKIGVKRGQTLRELLQTP